MSEQALVQGRGIVRRFAARAAVAGVDLQLEPGERLALIGPNGAGKTTLLRVLAGLLRADEGELAVGGHAFPEHRDRARAMIGYLGHDPLLYLDLTAAQNLEFYAAMYGAPSGSVLDELERVGLLARANDRARTFSRGMLQRLSIARMMIHRPRLLLLDEPYSGLDADGARVLDRVLDGLEPEQGLILVTHDLALVRRHAARLIVMHHGRVAIEAAGPELGDGLAERYAEALR